MIRILNLQPEVIELVKEGKLTEGHCKALLGIEDPEKQYQAAKYIIETLESIKKQTYHNLILQKFQKKKLMNLRRNIT